MLSVFRAAQTGGSELRISLLRRVVSSLKQCSNEQARRKMSGGHRVMEKRPSRFEYEQWKDHLHFYTLLGVIPLTIFTTFMNLYVGQAVLTEIPEDYEPEHWEYYKSPISRIYSKCIHHPLQKTYEANLHFIKLAEDKKDMRAFYKKVMDIQSDNADYKGWFYVPYNAATIYRSHEQNREELEEYQGTQS